MRIYSLTLVLIIARVRRFKIYSKTMEWGENENRIAVSALHKVGQSPSAIFKLLQKLNLSRQFVYRTIRRYDTFSCINDLERSGRPRTVWTPQATKAIMQRNRRNPRRKQNILAREMNISLRTISRILNEGLGLKAYKRRTGHLLTPALKEIRRVRAKALLKRYAGDKYRQILFSDEKIFTIEEKINRQNERVYAHSSKEAGAKVRRVERGHYPSSVMVWWGISYAGVTSLHFCKRGVKTTAGIYQEDILKPIVKPLTNTMFKGKHWSFQ